VRVLWSQRALERVAEIADWIAADRPEAADRLVEGLLGAVERLARFPESGRQVPGFERRDLREVVFRGYRILYRLGTERVEILTVRHSLQDLAEQDFGDDPVV
jgi:toxin ParE1/3/4